MTNTDTTAGMNVNSASSLFTDQQKRKRTTQGRKKIDIKKIEKVSNRHVTFSKRRTGLFNKASEICILTGAEAAILVQSEGKRFYSFAHPTVDGVINRYLSKDGNIADAAAAAISPEEIREYNAEYDRLQKELEAEKKEMEKQEKATNKNGSNYWWEEEIGHMDLEQLKQYEVALEELQKNLLTKADEMALVRNSRHHGMLMNGVDLNLAAVEAPAAAAAAISPYGADFNFNNHASTFIPYASTGININNPVYGNNHQV